MHPSSALLILLSAISLPIQAFHVEMHKALNCDADYELISGPPDTIVCESLDPASSIWTEQIEDGCERMLAFFCFSP